MVSKMLRRVTWLISFFGIPSPLPRCIGTSNEARVRTPHHGICAAESTGRTPPPNTPPNTKVTNSFRVRDLVCGSS
jgi:hypothetical protein